MGVEIRGKILRGVCALLFVFAWAGHLEAAHHADDDACEVCAVLASGNFNPAVSGSELCQIVELDPPAVYSALPALNAGLAPSAPRAPPLSA